MEQIIRELQLTILSRTKITPVSDSQLAKMKEVASVAISSPKLIGEAVIALKEHTGKTYTQCEKGIQIMLERDILVRFGNVIKIR